MGIVTNDRQHQSEKIVNRREDISGLQLRENENLVEIKKKRKSVKEGIEDTKIV